MEHKERMKSRRAEQHTRTRTHSWIDTSRYKGSRTPTDYHKTIVESIAEFCRSLKG